MSQGRRESAASGGPGWRPTADGPIVVPGAILPVRSGRPSRRRLLFAGVTMLLWTLPQVTGMLSVFRDTLQSHFAISIDQFGLMISIGAIPGMLGAVLGGRLVDRRGPRVVLRVCLFGAAVGMAMAALAGEWIYLLVALGVTALFSSPMWIAAQSYLVRLFPRRRRRVLSLSLVAMSITGVAVPLLAEGLLHLRRTHPSVSFSHILHIPFAVTAGVLLLAVPLYRRRKALGAAAAVPSVPGESARRPLDKSALLLVGMMVVHDMCDNSAMMWMPRVLGSSSYAERPLLPGVVTAGFSLAYVLARGLLSVLPEQWGRRAMLIAPGVVGSAVLLAGILSRSQAVTAVCYVVGGFCWSFEFPAILSTLAGSDGRRFGSALGLLSVGSGLATFALANTMGLLARSLGDASLWMILILPAAGFPLVSLGGVIWVWRFGRGGPGPEARAKEQPE